MEELEFELFFLHVYFYSFIFGCAGSSLLHGLSLVVVSRGYSLVAVCGLLTALASLVAEHGLQGPRASVVVTPRLQSTGSRV